MKYQTNDLLASKRNNDVIVGVIDSTRKNTSMNDEGLEEQNIFTPVQEEDELQCNKLGYYPIKTNITVMDKQEKDSV